MARGRLVLFDGAKLRALRQARNLTLTQLAALIGALPTSVSRWETGDQKPDPRAALALARTFDVPIRALTVLNDGEDGPHPAQKAAGYDERVALGELRMLAGLTSADAADRLGILRKQLSAYENGHTTPPPDMRDQMARIYAVQPSEVDAAIERAAGRWRDDLEAARDRARRSEPGTSS